MRRRLAGRRVEPSLSIAAAVELYLSLMPGMVNRRGKVYAAGTVRNHREALRPFAAWCGDRHVSELSGELVGEYLGSLRAEAYAAWTVATRDKVLRIWCGWLVRRGLLSRSPMAGSRRLAAADPPVDVFRAGELSALRAACDTRTWAGTRDLAVLMVLWRCGVRASELASLELGDYDRGARRLRVLHGKGDTHRVIGVPDDAGAALDDWVIALRGEEPGPLFPSDRGGRLSKDSVGRLVRRLGGRANVAGVHPHRFRHTFAVDFLLAGGDSAILMRLLGHSSLAMTIRYLRAVQQLQAADRHVETMRGRRR